MSARQNLQTQRDTNDVEDLSFKNWEERYHFCLNLGLLLNAGISLFKALGIMADLDHKEPGRDNIRDIAESLSFRVSAGLKMSQAVSLLPWAFPNYFNRMLRATEQSGDIGETLLRFAEMERKAASTRQEMAGILAYPFAVVAVSFVVAIAALMALTRLLPIFESTKSPLLVYIQGANAIWSTLIHPISLLLFTSCFFVFAWALREENLRRGLRFALRKIWFKAPGVKNLLRYSSNILFCQTLSKLYEVGTPVAEAIEPALLAADDPIFDSKVRRKPNDESAILYHYKIFTPFLGGERKGMPQKESLYFHLLQGGSLSKALEMEPDLFLPQVRSMVQVGEESSTIPECLRSAASLLELELLYRSQQLKNLIEPIVLSGIGIFVGLFALLSLAPMLEVMKL